MEIRRCDWITVNQAAGDVCPVFRRAFGRSGPVERATLEITALGVYRAAVNGRPVSGDVLSPGWTSYDHRLQVQRYDITPLIEDQNELRVTVGRGWFRSPMPGWLESADKARRYNQPCGLIARMTIQYAGGKVDTIATDGAWQWAEGPVRFSEIYDGERYDARIEPDNWRPVAPLAWPTDILIPQEGEPVREQERVAVRQILRTPAGETVLDFGQELTGYVAFSVNAKAGDIVRFTHGEVLDAKGNFYNENYRSAKAEVAYVCRDGAQTWHPQLTFFGFRYVKLIDWPGAPRPEQFTAIAVYSDMKRTGWLECGDAQVNRLFSNIVWGQKGNFLDVPTDCPQRDERLGWTGDAQVFIRTATYLFDAERFFRKWLRDLAADQRKNGAVGFVVPDVMPEDGPSAAWGDAAAICPWQVYQAYGDADVLREQFDSMCRWVDFIAADAGDATLWLGKMHFGDWLGLDAPSGSYKGSTREDFIANAFYAHSTDLVIRAGRLLGRDVSRYEALRERIVAAFRETFADYRTQTEHVLALRFGLAEHPQAVSDALSEMVRRDGTQLRTGFVGTPYILHVLSEYGHADVAWDLALRREYPGWLYPVGKGATTIWEHWDGIREDGGFWSADMNSFNHYSYGAVGDWFIERAAGIRHDDDHPGFSELIYAPLPDARLGWLHVRLDTRHGTIDARWTHEAGGFRYELTTPVPAAVCLGGEARRVAPGSYVFWTEG